MWMIVQTVPDGSERYVLTYGQADLRRMLRAMRHLRAELTVRRIH